MSRLSVAAGTNGACRALHVVAGLAPARGGPSYSVPRLCAALREAGCAASVLTLQEEEKPAGESVEAFLQDRTGLHPLDGLQASAGLRRATRAAAGLADIVHAHGLWRMPNVYAGAAAARVGRPLVVSPRGMLAPEALKFSAWKKRIFWALVQGSAYAGAAAWHATSAQEAADIRAFGIRAPIAVIPNGIDLPFALADHPTEKRRRCLLFLSRLHPKKGLSTLVSAWAKTAPQRPDWDLVIAGPDEGGYRAIVQAQADSEGASRISFLGAVYGVRKDEVLRAADLFVLPTKSESFGIAVAEALACGLPAIVTRGAPWAGLEIERCGWWVDHGPEALAAALLEATSLPAAERRAMGARGHAWMARAFAWNPIATQLLDVYRWLRDGGSTPACIVGD